jgi:hypothetical protein
MKRGRSLARTFDFFGMNTTPGVWSEDMQTHAEDVVRRAFTVSEYRTLYQPQEVSISTMIPTNDIINEYNHNDDKKKH